ncbi:MAG: SirB2 family protein [Gammaproteobacteria bacterium]|nr:SirB2 family protein [Gammaproteobacteria bacterium]
MIKTIHVTTVLVTLALFLFRGGWYYARYRMPLPKPLRILPHLNDTVLTITGITMAVSYGINPFVETWFLAKLIALFAYIGLGMYAFRNKRLQGKHLWAWVIALLVFFYIIGVVRTHQLIPGVY